MKNAAPCYYHLDVEVSPERIGQVRRILGAHLRHWDLDSLVESVCHCAEVLLHTIDEHAADKHTTLEMWWNGSHLITAVQDGDRDIEPHYAPRGPLSQIAALSDGWGCCAATATGGKIIWFSRRAPAAERAPLAATAPSPTLWESCRIPRALREPAYATATETQGGGS